MPTNAHDARNRIAATAIVLAFAASGFAALVYEISWIRRSALLFGSTTQAVSTVVAVFFLGLGAGSELGGRLSRRVQNPILWFAAAEVLVAASALATLPLFDFAAGLFGPAYRHMAQLPWLLVAIRVALIAALLLPPTVAMGVGLPLLTRHFVHTRSVAASRVGLLYALNTVGAVAGAAAAGWWLIPKIGLSLSIGLAALVNLTAAATIMLAARVGPRTLAAPEPLRTRTAAPMTVVTFLFFISGFVALANEVVWTRLASLLVHNSVLTYTLVLTLVLTGLVLGSALAALALRSFAADVASAAVFYGLLQMLAALAFVVSIWLPAEFWRGLDSPATVYALLLIPATTLSGALLPVAVRMVVDNAAVAGGRVGRLYAVNVAGGVAGSLVCGFVLIPLLGLSGSARLTALLGVAAGATAWILLGPARRWLAYATTAVAAMLWLWLPGAANVSVPADLLATPERLVTYREGASAHVAVVRQDGVTQMEIDRWWQGSTRKNHQSVAAHIPLLLHGSARNVLVIGAGAGQTPARVLMYNVEKVDVVDIEPAVFAVISEYFDGTWMHDERVRLLRDDGRSHIRNTAARYDVIAIEAGQLVRPGVANFYTLDFYDQARNVLAPGGLLAQFVPLPFLTPAQFAVVVETFRQVFPQSVLWYNTEELLLIGCNGQFPVCGADRLAPLNIAAVRADLAYSHWGGPAQYLVDPHVFAAGFLIGPDGLRELGRDAVVYRDDRPWLEYELARRNDWTPALTGLVGLIRNHLEDAQDVLGPLPGVIDRARVNELREYNLGDIAAEAAIRQSRGQTVGIGQIERLLQTAVAANPLSVRANRMLGDVFAARGELDMARRFVDTALEIDPDDIAGLRTLAFIHTGQQHYTAAINALQRVLELGPGDASLYNDLGVALASAGDLYGARRHFEQALEIEPGFNEARLNLSRLKSLLP